MPGPSRSFVVALVVCVCLSGIAVADDTARDGRKPLTTPTWQPPDPPVDLHWHLLALPSYLVEAALTPIGLLVTLTQRYRLDRRVVDFLRNDAGTIGVTPRVKLSTGDGFGGGAALWFKNGLGKDQPLAIGGLARINGDYEAELRFETDSARLEGRGIEGRLLIELDQNDRYFGIGNDTKQTDRRALQRRIMEAGLTIDVFRAGLRTFFGQADLSWMRERLTTGTHPVYPGVMEGDSVAPPPGFNESRHYAKLSTVVGFDNRDTIGRPTRGVKTGVRLTAATDTKAELAAVALTASFTTYLRLLPEHRVLSLSVGARAAHPIAGRDVPLNMLTVLGGDEVLRGYLRGRFRDRLGWWSTAEYSWPVYELLNTGVHLHTVLFADVGRVGRVPGDLIESPLRYSVGVGLRGVHDADEGLSLFVGFSPEGVQVGLNAGSVL